jgi:hypothetical protein
MKFLFFMLLFVTEFTSAQVTDSTIAAPAANKNRVLIINIFDAGANRYRKNKKELFEELADSLKSVLANEIKSEGLSEPVIIPKSESPIFNLKRELDSILNLYKACCAIVIEKLDAFFEQTSVDVSRGDDGSKSRTASYDICAAINYSFYKTGEAPYFSDTKNCEHFTTRHVMSGLLAGGPDIVGKSRDAFKITAKNADLYIWKIADKLK